MSFISNLFLTVGKLSEFLFKSFVGKIWANGPCRIYVEYSSKRLIKIFGRAFIFRPDHNTLAKYKNV